MRELLLPALKYTKMKNTTRTVPMDNRLYIGGLRIATAVETVKDKDLKLFIYICYNRQAGMLYRC